MRTLSFFFTGAATLLGLASACSSTSDNCLEISTCPPTGGASGASGAGAGGAGPGGHSGNGNGGATGGSGPAGGNAGSNAQAGEAGAPPCNDSCSGTKPVCLADTNTCVECTDNSTCASPNAACDTATNTCVECVDTSTCRAPKAVCDTATNTCVECTVSTDCKDASKPFCDTTANQCVACLKQTDCTSPTASACNAGACTACTKDAECSDIAGKGVCNAGTCAQCTAKNSSACGSSMGTPLVCDSLAHKCTTNKQASAGLCQPCVSDAQCSAGKMCVQEQFGSPAQSVGYFCFWKQGDVADGAPADCPTQGRPYVKAVTNAVSIDGAKSDICSLRSSTCVAKNEFSSKDCKNAAAPDDSLCGFAPTKDSKCSAFGTGFRCTMTCGSDDDCPSSFTCNTGATPQVCNLQ